MIVESPLKNLAPRLLRPDPERPKDHVAAALWMAVGGVVAAVDWLLTGLGEWHVETVDTSGTPIPHRLGRRPFGRVIVRQDGNRIVYDDYEQWTTQKVVMRTGAGSFEVAFFLFVALLALAAPEAYAAECASYGYTQGDVVKLWICETASDTTTGAAEGDYRYNKDTNAALTYDGAAWNAMGGGSGAPTGAQYWTGAADAGLSAEHNLGALSTGLVINTAGTPSTYAGTSCTNQFPRSLSASGAATCASVASADLNLTATTCTNEFITAISSGAAGTCSKAVLAGAQFASQGTTTTVLHGNAAGNPSWAAVHLTNDVTGTLPVGNLTDDATSGLCLLSGGAGDPAWTTCPGGGGGLSYAQVSASALAGF